MGQCHKEGFPTLDQVDSEPDLHSLASSGVNETDVNGYTMFFICLHDLGFVVVVPAWTKDGWMGAFSAKCTTLLDCGTRIRKWSTHSQKCTAPHLSRETCMSTGGTSGVP